MPQSLLLKCIYCVHSNCIIAAFLCSSAYFNYYYYYYYFCNFNVCHCRFEGENKQLLQVISQLRQVRRQGKDDVDGVAAERDSERARANELQTEVDRSVI